MSESAAPLMDFQRNTVEYVLERLYDSDDSTDRFLVADEVGMGKTLVGRGVIDGTIERLQGDSTVDRIDIIYICSNAGIAAQNIAKLHAGVERATPLSTRISMLATQISDLNKAPEGGGKPINFVAITPGTSFAHGSGGGRMEERALLYWMLESYFDGGVARGQLGRTLRNDVNRENWDWAVKLVGLSEPDDVVREEFDRALTSGDGAPVLAELREFIEARGRSWSFSGEERSARWRLIGKLRRLLAKASVNALEPDLVILDEFQRFKNLINEPKTDSERETKELADELFDAETAKVLLLSATPYKAYTLAEEKGDDEHYADFIETVKFLESGNESNASGRLAAALAELRSRVVTGGDSSDSARQVEALLRPLMCRTERPTRVREEMRKTISDFVEPPTAQDLLGYVALKRISEEVDGALAVDYWKSAPYFLNFMDGYKLAEQFKAHQFSPERRAALLKNAQVLPSAGSDEGTIDYGNSRLRSLAKETIDEGLWKLAWIPPSMPYYSPSGPFAEVEGKQVTKTLIFSSWAAAPTAIASLLSREATRLAHDFGRGPAAPFPYRVDGERPGDMTALALFLPTPGLADLVDPLDLARRDPNVPISADAAKRLAAETVAEAIATAGEASSELSRDTWYWAAPFQIGGAGYSRDLVDAVASGGGGESNAGSDLGGFAAHVDLANRVDEERLGAQPADLTEWVSLVGMAGPGNAAWRALSRLAPQEVTREGLLIAAAVIGAGFRSLFRHEEVAAIVGHYGNDQPYWKSVLEYCLGGNIQAMLDEYLHHQFEQLRPADDEELLSLARDVHDALALKEARNTAFDPNNPEDGLSFGTRFALRFGSSRGTAKSDDSAVQRADGVRKAFNSPFWPMVLASTSVGQEGIDFHWWCHSLVHWNLPANPVDVEQREGRIHRYKGHAIRKNVAKVHRVDALQADANDPWAAAFDAASSPEVRPEGVNDLWPCWTYPLEGGAEVRSLIASYPLSRDGARERRILEEVQMYRLVFGQPRQEELLGILKQQGVEAKSAEGRRMLIDLRPPSTPPDS